MPASVGPPVPGPTPHETLLGRGAALVPSTPTERADLLEETDWSRALSWPDLVSFAQRLTWYRLSEGDVLFEEGDQDAFLAIVVRGLLAIRKHNLSGRDRLVALIGHAKMVGEMSVLDGGTRSATAIAAKPTEILVLTAGDFEAICAEHPRIGIKVVRAIATAIAQLLRQTTGALVDLMQG